MKRLRVEKTQVLKLNLRLLQALPPLFLLAIATGCQPSSSEAQPEQPANAASEENTSNDVAEGSAPAEPRIEAGAVNELGQIVLGTSEDESEPAPQSGTEAGQPRLDLELPEAESVPTISAETTQEVDVSPEAPASLASLKSQSKLPAEANVATEAERNQQIAVDWPEPQAVIFVSGQQHGYLEPCGCTGLESQKGGLIRRDTLLTTLSERGWNLIPIDVGNQVRRLGRQPELKFQASVEALITMNYQAVAFGIDDLKLSSVELIQAASTDSNNKRPFISSNVAILDPSFFPESQIVDAGGRKIGITAVLGKEFEGQLQSDDIIFSDPVESAASVVEKLKKAECDFIVLLAHASLEESAAIAKAVPGIDLVVTAGGYGEPTLNAESIPGSKSKMVQVGVKGMYGGIVGIFDDEDQPIRYQKIAISSQFKDSPRMLEQFAEYQNQLKEDGLQGLGLTPTMHPTGRKFVGSETCGDCHTTAYDVWKNSPHFNATESIVSPPNDRGGIARHFDPECISCHVTGWNTENHYPYESGYLNLAESELLLGNGCENCHGPGSEHVAAESGDVDANNELLTKLREQMQLPLARAREKCLECHDLDNDPDFQHDGAFEEYWEQIKHYGKD